MSEKQPGKESKRRGRPLKTKEFSREAPSYEPPEELKPQFDILARAVSQPYDVTTISSAVTGIVDELEASQSTPGATVIFKVQMYTTLLEHARNNNDHAAVEKWKEKRENAQKILVLLTPKVAEQTAPPPSTRKMRGTSGR